MVLRFYNKKRAVKAFFLICVSIVLVNAPLVHAEIPLGAATKAIEAKQGDSNTPNSPSTIGSALDSAKSYLAKPWEFIQEAWNTHLFAKKDDKTTGDLVAQSKVNLPDPVSHEATYSIEFEAEEESEFADAKGQMTIEMVRYDGNWITKQTSSLEIAAPDDGKPIKTETFLSTLEDQDGLNYQFAAEAKADESIQENIQGRARLVREDGHGTVVYEAPEELKVDLPAPTVFPIKHLKMLLDASKHVKGKSFQIVKATVFDGSSDVRDAVRVEAIVTPVDPATKEIRIDNPSLMPKKLWRAQMRIFTQDNLSGEADYTITQVFSEQGVLFEVSVDYGDYKMVSTLTHLKIYGDKDTPSTLKFGGIKGISMVPASNDRSPLGVSASA